MLSKSMRCPKDMHAAGAQRAGQRHDARRSWPSSQVQSPIADAWSPVRLLWNCCSAQRQRKFVETFVDREVFGAAVELRSPVDAWTDVLPWLRWTTPASINPCSAFCITSTEFANASIEKINLSRNTFFGMLLVSRSVGERLTRSTRTIDPPTVISSTPSV